MRADNGALWRMKVELMHLVTVVPIAYKIMENWKSQDSDIVLPNIHSLAHINELSLQQH
jgi:hypothetical protein